MSPTRCCSLRILFRDFGGHSAIAVRNFLDHTSSQLTYHGLFTLISALPPGFSSCAVPEFTSVCTPQATSSGPVVSKFKRGWRRFRRQESSSITEDVIGDEDSSLYSLVTDVVFLHESSVVWERLEDVDGGLTSFVDADSSGPAPLEATLRVTPRRVPCVLWRKLKLKQK